MTQIHAIYRQGVFQPTDPVNFAEEQRVRLSIEAASDQSPLEWLDLLKPLHATVAARHGCLPDSTLDIAMDRAR